MILSRGIKFLSIRAFDGVAHSKRIRNSKRRMHLFSLLSLGEYFFLAFFFTFSFLFLYFSTFFHFSHMMFIQLFVHFFRNSVLQRRRLFDYANIDKKRRHVPETHMHACLKTWKPDDCRDHDDVAFICNWYKLMGNCFNKLSKPQEQI